MIEIVLVVREPGSLKPDYSLKFSLPAVPKAGDYISINRPDHPQPYSEDVIVRQVWWRLHHPDTRSSYAEGDEMTGRLTELFVECEVGLGPYAADHWRKYNADAEKFEVSRFAVRESQIAPAK